MKTYSVKKLFQGRAELEVGRFNTEIEATDYTKQELEKDALMKVNAIYRIYHFDEDLIAEWDQAKWQKEGPAKTSDSSSSSQGSGQRFSPSPIQTAPRPPGMPASSWKKDEEDKDK